MKNGFYLGIIFAFGLLSSLTQAGEALVPARSRWKQAGGDLMCIYSSTGTWSKWGSWGLTEYFAETENDQPKYRVVLDWNRRNPTPSFSGEERVKAESSHFIGILTIRNSR